MNNENHSSSIHERVESAIRSGQVKARSRFVIGLQILSVLLTAAAALSVSVLTLSFVLYSVFESGEAFLLGFGWSGIGIFLLLFPWTLLAIALLCIVLFQWRLSYLVPSYRVPLVILFGLLLVGVIGLGYLFTPLHTSLSKHIHEKNVPLLDELYENIYESREGYGVYRGFIVSVEETGFHFIRSDKDADRDDMPRFVLIPHLTQQFHIGDEVFIVGKQEDGVIRASQLATFPDRDK